MAKCKSDRHCMGCRKFSSYGEGGQKGRNHDNCATWLCNEGGCPHDQEFKDADLAQGAAEPFQVVSGNDKEPW